MSSYENFNKKEFFFIKNGIKYLITCSEKITIFHTVLFFGYKLDLIVIEYNGVLLPIKNWKTTFLKEDDKLEIVTIVGGG